MRLSYLERVDPDFDFNLSDWRRTVISTPQRRGKTALSQEIQMRHVHQAITSDDLIDIGNITGRELWDAANEAKLSSVARAELFNRIMNNRGSETLSFREFKDRWSEFELTKPHVSVNGHVGKVQGYIFDPHSQYHYVSVGGELYQRTGIDTIKIFADNPIQAAQEAVDEYAAAVASIEGARKGFTVEGFKRAGASDIWTEHTARWVLENLDSLRGQTIEIRRFVHPGNGANMKGALENAWQTSKYNVTFLFLNNTLGAESLDTMVKLYEPNYCRAKKQHKFQPNQTCYLLLHHYGNHMFD